MREEAGGKHPLRCETCDHWKGHYDVPFCKFWDDKIPITKYGVDLIGHVGCASHSSAPQPAAAAEQRIKDVIAELERRKRKGQRQGYTTWPQSALINSISYDEAISLLRGDGK